MYCKNCNAEIDPAFKYCMECGAPVRHDLDHGSDAWNDSNVLNDDMDDISDDESSYYTEDYDEQIPIFSRGRYQTQSESRFPFKIIATASCVLILVLILLIIIGSCDNSSETESHENEIYASESVHVPDSTKPDNIEATLSEGAGSNQPPTEVSNYVTRSREVALLEYDKYIEAERIRAFMGKANSNNITIDMLNRQPEYYIGKEVYFGGTVLQTMYDTNDSSAVDLRVKVNGAKSANNVIYVTYKLKDGNMRILEDDYVDLYGTFDGMITYEAVLGNNVTIPRINGEHIYCHADISEPVTTPVMNDALSRISKNFKSSTGEIFSFSNLKNAEDNIFSDATNYGDCIVLYYSPYEGWDVNNPPPFYRITTFKDGVMVIFEPNLNAAEGLYSIDDGTYTEYMPTNEVVDIPIATQPTSTPTSIPVNKEGYVIASSGGLNIRSGPSINYDKVGRLDPLTVVVIQEIQSDGTMDWGRISQGWVSMDYIAFGDPPAEPINTTPQHIISQYVGHWGDFMSRRCMMTIEYYNNMFTFELSWGNGASSTSKWLFTGSYDSVSNTVRYSNGRHYTMETSDSGEQQEIIHYTNGSGYFFLADDGYIYWEDHTENQGVNCIFEKTGY